MLYNFTGTFHINVFRGAAGLPGEPGNIGAGDPGGFGGDPGHKGTGFSCDNAANDGKRGDDNESYGPGDPGDFGTPGSTQDHDGIFEEKYQMTVNGPTCPMPPDDCSGFDPPAIWSQSLCQCLSRHSPIIVDVNGDGVALTSYTNGVEPTAPPS